MDDQLINQSMIISQFKECLRLVTAEKNLIGSGVFKTYRKEILLEVSPKWTTTVNIYMTFPIISRETGKFLNYQ